MKYGDGILPSQLLSRHLLLPVPRNPPLFDACDTINQWNFLETGINQEFVKELLENNGKIEEVIN